MLLVEGDSAAVGLADFQEDGFDATALAFGKCRIEKYGCAAFAAPVRTNSEVQKLHFSSGVYGAERQKAKKDLAIANHPPADVTHLEFEFARSPLRGLRA